jgi:hypothetical protein
MFPSGYGPADGVPPDEFADAATAVKNVLGAAVSNAIESDPDSATDPVRITQETVEGGSDTFAYIVQAANHQVRQDTSQAIPEAEERLGRKLESHSVTVATDIVYALMFAIAKGREATDTRSPLRPEIGLRSAQGFWDVPRLGVIPRVAHQAEDGQRSYAKQIGRPGSGVAAASTSRW